MFKVHIGIGVIWTPHSRNVQMTRFTTFLELYYHWLMIYWLQSLHLVKWHQQWL